jgi:uncharacterized protein YdaU (DUF1376 family)
MSSRPDGFMPLYIGDYLADTSHLSTAEHGAYILLLMHYWRTGLPLTDDDAALSRIARATRPEWRSARGAVRAFFRPAIVNGNNVLVHSRVERELMKAKERYEAKRKASVLANEKRWGSHRVSETQSQNDPPAIPNGSFCDPQSQSHSSNEENKSSLRSDLGQERTPRRKSRKALPEPFPDDSLLDWATDFWGGQDRQDLVSQITEQIAQFRDYHAKEATLAADWPATWRTWVRNALRFNKRENSNGKTNRTAPGSKSFFDACVDSIRGSNPGDSEREPDQAPPRGTVTVLPPPRHDGEAGGVEAGAVRSRLAANEGF